MSAMVCAWMRLAAAAAVFLGMTAAVAADRSAAATFRFVNNEHGLTGAASGAATVGGFQMTLAAGPSGALLIEDHPQGMGVDSAALALDSGDLAGVSKLNILGAAGPGHPAEFITFSFNRAGMILDLLFDGVKDETLEYMTISLPGGETRTYFDFETVFRLTQQGFDSSWLAAPGVTLLDGADDDRRNANIPFHAGEEFAISYGEIPFPPGYHPLQNEAGNGARWEGLVVVPEPGVAGLMGIAAAGLPRRRRSGRA